MVADKGDAPPPPPPPPPPTDYSVADQPMIDEGQAPPESTSTSSMDTTVGNGSETLDGSGDLAPADIPMVDDGQAAPDLPTGTGGPGDLATGIEPNTGGPGDLVPGAEPGAQGPGDLSPGVKSGADGPGDNTREADTSAGTADTLRSQAEQDLSKGFEAEHRSDLQSQEQGSAEDIEPPADTKMHIDGDPGESPLASTLEKPEMKSALDNAWKDSQADSYDSRHEEGGWIIRDEVTDESRVERVPPGVRAGISFGQQPTLGADEHIEATFHTHPNPEVDEIGNTWQPGPSPEDRAWADHKQIPVVVRTANDVYVYFPRSTR
jgi:hypothetical protein